MTFAAISVPVPALMALSFLAGYGVRVMQASTLAWWRRGRR